MAQLFGEVLVREGLVDEEGLKEALAAQATEKPRRRLGEILMELRGLRDEVIAFGLARQLGIEMVDPVTATVDTDLLARLDDRRARRLKALPLYRTPEQLVRVVVADPRDLSVRRDLEFALGAKVDLAIASGSRIDEAIEKHYTLRRYLSALLQEVRPGADAQSAVGNLDIPDSEIEAQVKQGGSRPYAGLLNYLLGDAAAQRTSDIHVEPLEKELRIRYRIDGTLREAVRLPRWVEAGLVSRLKVLSGLDIAERKRTQEGRLRLHLEGRDMDLRVSIVPSRYGETAVVRLLDPAIIAADLSSLGFRPAVYRTYYRMITRPQGLVLITGPTGSGKSTTLYATINRLYAEETSICTIEDPVEYSLDGVTQVNVDERRRMTFAHCVKTMLRQDPNVLVVGEIRDAETAQAACQAALTGHLVLSTLHTNDSTSSISRLLDLEVPPYLIGATLVGAMAQRLVRVLCPSCRVPAELSDLDWDHLGIAPVPLQGTLYRLGPGCADCRRSGWRGRTGIFEFLTLDDDLRGLLFERADERTLRNAALKKGMRTLLDDGLLKVAEGMTTLDEVARVVPASVRTTLRAVPTPDSYSRRDLPTESAGVFAAGEEEAAASGELRALIPDVAATVAPEVAAEAPEAAAVAPSLPVGEAPAEGAGEPARSPEPDPARDAPVAPGSVDEVAGPVDGLAAATGDLPAAPRDGIVTAALDALVAPGSQAVVAEETGAAVGEGTARQGRPRGDGAAGPVLVVDDAEEILELVRFTLESAGFAVLTASDGQSALDLARDRRLSAIVLDVMMPGLSGFDVCRRLREDPATAGIPVLMLSARGDIAHVKSGFKAGADDYLPKPFDPEELELRVRSLLRRAARA